MALETAAAFEGEGVMNRATESAIAYYTECWAARFREGHNPRSRAIHYGLHTDTSDDDFESAKLRLNELVAAHLRIDSISNPRVLDLGCGVGGTTVDLARRHSRWRLVGVDATSASLDLARDYARECAVAERTEFTLDNYQQTKLEPAFDGAYAIESACHATDRPQLLREVKRLLAPSRRFAVVDFFRTSLRLTKESASRYEDLKRGFAVTDYYDRDFHDQMRKAGFEGLEIVELTQRVRPSTARSARRARQKLEGGADSSLMRDHLLACVAVDALCESGHLVYRLVSGAS